MKSKWLGGKSEQTEWCQRALLLAEGQGQYRESYQANKLWVLRLEFETFVQAFVRLPCQIVRTGRRLLYGLMSSSPYQPILFRLVDVLRC